KRVKILNMFEDLKPYKSQKSITHRIKEKGLVHVKDMKQKTPSFRYFKNGLYMHYKRINEDEKLSFIDYMKNERQRTMSEEYNSHGFISQSRHMILNKNRSRLDRYFDDKGNCFVSLWLNSTTLKEIRFFGFIDDPKEIESLHKFR